MTHTSGLTTLPAWFTTTPAVHELIRISPTKADMLHCEMLSAEIFCLFSIKGSWKRTEMQSVLT